MPSSSGMRMSMSTTSGRSSSARSTASAPSARLADDLQVVLGVEDHPEPRAHERLVVGDQDADAHAACTSSRASGSRARTSNPPSARGPASTSPPNALHALAHPYQPAARPVAARAAGAPARCR